jgi:cytochrome oxidase assembly protein ShyY1
VLVDRGYVKPVEGNKVPEFADAPTVTVTVTARLRDSELLALGKQPFRQDGAQQVYSINTDQIAEVTGVPLAGSYLQLVDNQPGGLGVIGLPHLDSGPFLSYGIQWIAFGIVAPVGVGYFVVAEYKQRRRERAAAPASPSTSGEPVTLSKDQKLDDRYGRRR